MAIINGCCGFGNSYSFTQTGKKYNFDVDANDWSTVGITDQQSFNSVFGVTTNAFKIEGNNIQANITSLTDNQLNFVEFDITNINYITVEGLISLDLRSNKIREFNPSKKLPSTLEELNLFRNDMRFFTPEIKLPSNMQYINLSENYFTTIGYAASENWASSIYIAVNGGSQIYFENNLNTVSGTNLETILQSKGWTVIA